LNNNIYFTIWEGENSSFGFFSVGFCVGKKPNVLFVQLVFSMKHNATVCGVSVLKFFGSRPTEPLLLATNNLIKSSS